MHPDDPAQATATDRVYGAVYRAILEHRAVPGMRLREEELAAEFQVSRTVVRQALQRLAQDGLVALQHNRGAQVVVPTREQAAQVFEPFLSCFDMAEHHGGGGSQTLTMCLLHHL